MANQGVAPPDFTTAVGQVRLLIGDTDAVIPDEGQAVGTYVFYSDAEIAGLLAIYGTDPRRAAAAMLRTIAMTPALLLKKFQSADVAVDGPAVADSLLAIADSLEASIKSGAADFAKLGRTGARVHTDYDPLLDAAFYQQADNRLVLDVEQGILP